MAEQVPAKDDPAKHDPLVGLDSLEAVARYLADAFDSGDAEHVANALANVAKSSGLAELAAAVGMPREQLRDALSSGELSLDTTLEIMKVIDLNLPPRPDGGAAS
jgi:probable addiction module antidote protein